MRFLLVSLDYFYSIATNSFDTFDEKTGILKKVLWKYLVLNPNSITPTLLLHNTTCLFTATYSPRIRDDDVNVNNKTATTGCSVLSLQEQEPAETPPPALGEHSEEVLSQLLGLDEETLAGLRERGVIGGSGS